MTTNGQDQQVYQDIFFLCHDTVKTIWKGSIHEWVLLWGVKHGGLWDARFHTPKHKSVLDSPFQCWHANVFSTCDVLFVLAIYAYYTMTLNQVGKTVLRILNGWHLILSYIQRQNIFMKYVRTDSGNETRQRVYEFEGHQTGPQQQLYQEPNDFVKIACDFEMTWKVKANISFTSVNIIVERRACIPVGCQCRHWNWPVIPFQGHLTAEISSMKAQTYHGMLQSQSFSASKIIRLTASISDALRQVYCGVPPVVSIPQPQRCMMTRLKRLLNGSCLTAMDIWINKKIMCNIKYFWSDQNTETETLRQTGLTRDW